jgi:hypothetical protein
LLSHPISFCECIKVAKEMPKYPPIKTGFIDIAIAYRKESVGQKYICRK